ncbi:MAG: hypothetical protein EOP84_26940, partial [Verrucomicrobiaceae bacterium]
MPVFEYKALQSNGAATQGQLEASGRQDAVRMLEDKGWTPVKVAEAAVGAPKAGSKGVQMPAGKAFSFKSNRVPFVALEDFTRSLSSLLAASVPLSRALTILYKETANPA